MAPINIPWELFIVCEANSNGSPCMICRFFLAQQDMSLTATPHNWDRVCSLVVRVSFSVVDSLKHVSSNTWLLNILFTEEDVEVSRQNTLTHRAEPF
jgi:hypothetical protein